MSNDQQGTPPPDDETQPVRPEGGTPPPAPAASDPAPADAAPAPTARRGFAERFRSLRRSDDGNRTFGLAALIASALAGIIVGGVGVSAVHAITHDGPRDRFDRGGWVQRQDDRGGPGLDGPGGMHGGPRGGVPGQLPPTTAPEDEGSAS